MYKKIISSFLLALHNIRSHFFHTLLSVLGIVIGVAALVAILSLIDGLEEYARDQITKTTSLKSVVVHHDPFHSVNNLRIRKDTFAVIDFEHFRQIKSGLTVPAEVHFRTNFTETVRMENSPDAIGASVVAMGSTVKDPEITVIEGRLPVQADIENKVPIAVVNLAFVNAIVPVQGAADVIGKIVTFRGRRLNIIGVVAGNRNKNPQLFISIALLTNAELKTNLPEIVLEAENVEDVQPLKEQVTLWLKATYPANATDFIVQTNDARVAQATKGFKLFRVVMGLIVGISVLVGGIGVMNVLLISVTERTVEIGIRKAVGANKRDIVLQFLSESITVSVFGSAIGLILGVTSTMVIMPIVTRLTEIPFPVSYTWNTLIVVSLLAVLIGITFGTYPAIRASRLDPVEAIRRE